MLCWKLTKNCLLTSCAWLTWWTVQHVHACDHVSVLISVTLQPCQLKPFLTPLWRGSFLTVLQHTSGHLWHLFCEITASRTKINTYWKQFFLQSSCNRNQSHKNDLRMTFCCCLVRDIGLLSILMFLCVIFHLIISLSLHFHGHFPGETGLAGVYWSKGWWKWWWQLDYWSYKSCKAPVKSPPPTNSQFFLQAGCPSCHPINSVKALKRKNITFHGLAYPKLTRGSSNFVSDH